MKIITRFPIQFSFLALLVSAFLRGADVSGVPPEGLSAPRIVETLKRSADWQLAEPVGNTVVNDWVAAPLYDGLLRLAGVSGDPRYLGAVIRFGRQAGWRPLERKYHADDVAVSHAWLDVYRLNPSRAERLEPTKARLDAVLAAPRKEDLDMRHPKKFPGVAATDRWTWCDALYMSPPSLARLAGITGDSKYLKFLDEEFRFTYDRLYDKQAGLFYRDHNYLEKRTPSGRKIFWSRGNGWVYGGLALLIEQLPKDNFSRSFYIGLFREMTAAVLAAQQPDGLWTPSMLDPAEVPIGETSGSAFFVFGLLWGVNEGILDRDTHLPAITRGWKGLLTRVRPDGYVGFVQRIGHAPDKVNAQSRQDYGTGAFLLAGSELVKLLGGAAAPIDNNVFLAKAEALAASDSLDVDALLASDTQPEAILKNRNLRVRVEPVDDKNELFDSGIDAWLEQVEAGVALDLAAPARGTAVPTSRRAGWCGLWIDDAVMPGKPARGVRIVVQQPGRAAVLKSYRYQVGKDNFEEQRIISLAAGQNAVLITSRIYLDRDPRPGMTVVLGCGKAGTNARLLVDPVRGVVAWSERTSAGESFTAVVTDAEFTSRSAGENAEGVCLLKTDANGEVRFSVHHGFSAISAPDAFDAFIAPLGRKS